MRNQSVLVVEDDAVFCKLLNLLLSNNNYEVKAVYDLLEAKSCLEHYHFDFLILDYRLAGANGLKLVEWISQKGKQINTILMSRLLDADLIKEAKAHGITKVIKKPLQPQDLLNLLNTL